MQLAVLSARTLCCQAYGQALVCRHDAQHLRCADRTSPEQHAGGDVRACRAEAANTLVAHANVGCRHQASNQEHAKHTSHQLQTRVQHLHIRSSLQTLSALWLAPRSGVCIMQPSPIDSLNT